MTWYNLKWMSSLMAIGILKRNYTNWLEGHYIICNGYVNLIINENNGHSEY
jgi:hypothetical protein